MHTCTQDITLKKEKTFLSILEFFKVTKKIKVIDIAHILLSISVYEFDYDMKNMHLIQRAEVKFSPEGRFLFASIRGYFTEKGGERLVRMEEAAAGALSRL